MNEIKAEELLNIANLDMKDGLYEMAVEKLNQILSENPDFGKAYNHLGWLYETQFQNYEKAEKFYKMALERSPEYHPIYTNYAILLSTIGKFDELRILLEQALKIPGIQKATIFNEYGIMYEQMGEFPAAITNYKECAKLTLNQDVLQRAKDSIARCKMKMEL